MVCAGYDNDIEQYTVKLVGVFWHVHVLAAPSDHGKEMTAGKQANSHVPSMMLRQQKDNHRA